MRTRTLIIAACMAMTATLTACGANGGGGGGGASAKNYPNRNLEWTIAFGPGGGNDIMSRTIVDVLEKEKLYPRDIAVQNLEGGSGAKGWGELFSNRGNPYSISTTSGSFITTPMQADTGWTWKDFTLVGLFATDNAVFLVSPKSGIERWEQWVDSAKSKDTMKVGGIGTVNVDYIQHQMLADKAGYEIDYVPFNDEGQLLTSLLSGALDAAVSNPSEVLGQVKADKLTPLLFTGEEPIDALPGVPTAEQKGFEGLPTLPRGLILPPDVPEDVRQWWIDTMKKVVETPAWQKYLDENALVEDVRWGPDFEAYLDQTDTQLENRLRELGAL